MDLGLPDLFPSGGTGIRPAVKLVKGAAGAAADGGFGGALLSAAAGALGLGAGQPDPLTDSLSSLSVQLAPAPHVATARLRFLPRSDFPGLAPGDELQIQLGWDGAPQPVFAGAVGTVAGRGDGALEVLVAGKAIALARLRENSAYEQQGFADLLNTWIGAAGLAAGDIASGPSYAFLAIDDRHSLWEWVARLARHADVPAWVDASGKLQAHAPAGAPVRSFKFGEDVLDLHSAARDPVSTAATVAGEGSAGRQGEQAWAWLAKDNSAATARAGSGASAPLASDGALRSLAAAAGAAAGMAAGAQRLGGTVQLSVPGTPELDIASVFAVEGCPGGRGDGSFAVLELRHRFSASGFTTELFGGGL